MNAPHEPLDEAIDRVASSMTQVSAAPDLAERIAARLADRPEPSRAGAIVAAVGIAASLVLATLWSMRPVEAPEPTPRLVANAPAPIAVPAREPVSADAPRVTAAPAPPPVARVATTQAIPPQDFGLPPIVPPSQLALEALAVDAIPTERVELAPLTVTDLAPPEPVAKDMREMR